MMAQRGVPQRRRRRDTLERRLAQSQRDFARGAAQGSRGLLEATEKLIGEIDRGEARGVLPPLRPGMPGASGFGVGGNIVTDHIVSSMIDVAETAVVMAAWGATMRDLRLVDHWIGVSRAVQGVVSAILQGASIRPALVGLRDALDSPPSPEEYEQ